MAAGFFDGSLEELAKKDSPLAVKRAINSGMTGSSVVCVLNGTDTWSRRWVRYEIFRSIELRKGLLVVDIHNISDPIYGKDNKGVNPLDLLGYAPIDGSKKLYPHEYANNGWRVFEDADPIDPWPYVGLNRGRIVELSKMSNVFRGYDWHYGTGHKHFSGWIHAAAKFAGRT